MTNIKKPKAVLTLIAASAVGLLLSGSAYSADEKMSFFITSDGNGDGANFGGLEGADAHCATLAKSAGSTKSWAAYLSTSMVIDRSSGSPQVTNGISARDRIGSGPWYNAKGELIANNVDELHSDKANINGCLLYTSPSPRDS